MIIRDTNIRRALRDKQRGFLLNPFRFGNGGDPNFASVVLLLKGETANGSTPVDSSSIARTLTQTGGALVSTAQAKYGAGSINFPSPSTLQAANSSDFFFGTGDFTIEYWLYLTGTGTQAIGAYANGSATNANYSFQVTVDGTIRIALYSGGTAYTAQAGTPSTNTWQHVAHVRSSGTLKSYLGGVGGSAVSANVNVNNPASSVFQIGRAQGFYPFAGYIDEYRITKGVGRYTADFTPPAAAFPTF